MTPPRTRPDIPMRQGTPDWDEVALVRVHAVRRRRRRHLWLSRLLLLAGLALVGYVTAKKIEAGWAQRWAAQRLESTAEAEEAPESPDPAPAPLPPPHGEPVARLSIPRISLDVVALEGVDAETLDRGAGHFPGSALPGEPGNASFAGHRDSFFRPLSRVQEGDEVLLETAGGGELAYRVTATRVVGPDEVDVVAPLPGRQLTLVTCYPFDWIGPAPRRFVVRAVLEGTQEADRAQGRAGGTHLAPSTG